MTVVYILRSLKTDEFYIGCTDNFPRRIKEHNDGKVRSTKSSKPFKIMLVQSYPTLSKARKIERRLKDLKRKDYIDKIIKDGFIKMDC